MSDVGKAWETVIAVLLGSAGGFSRLLHEKEKKKLKWGMILAELFISGFTGLMALFLARASFGLTGEWLGFLSGMVGWIRPRILSLMERPAATSIGIEMEKHKEKEAAKK